MELRENKDTHTHTAAVKRSNTIVPWWYSSGVAFKTPPFTVEEETRPTALGRETYTNTFLYSNDIHLSQKGYKLVFLASTAAIVAQQRR